AATGQPDRASAVAEQAFTEAKSIADPGSLLAVAGVMAVVMPLDEAIALASSIDDLDTRMNALGTIAVTLVKRGQLDRAAHVVDSIPERELNSCPPHSAVATLATLGRL